MAAKSPKPATPTPRRQVDWDAVERDFRTGKYTLRELGSAHKVSHAAIGKKSRDDKWKQDLSEQIRQATNALLTQELVSKEVDKGFQEISTVIQIGAEVAKQVILGHRTRLADIADAVATAKATLLSLSSSVVDMREAAVFVQAVGNLATATKTLIEQERKAFSIDSDKPETPSDSFAGFLADLSARGSRLPTGARHDA